MKWCKRSNKSQVNPSAPKANIGSHSATKMPGCLCKEDLGHDYSNVSMEPVDLDDIMFDGITREAKKAMAFVNPNSGSGKSQKALNIMRPIFREANVELIIKETEYAGHAIDLAREEDLTEISYLLAIGGDGTVSEVVNGFHTRSNVEELKNKVAIGVIPAGTGNTFAYDLGIVTIEQGARAVVGNKGRLVDIMQVMALDEAEEKKAGGPWYSINIVGFGLPAAVLNRYESFRCCALDCIRPALYEISAYCEVFKNPAYKCKIEFPDDTDIPSMVRERLRNCNDYIWVQAQNTIHMAGRIPWCPRAVLDDGLMDLTIIKHIPRLRFVQVGETGKAGKIETLVDDADYIQCRIYLDSHKGK